MILQLKMIVLRSSEGEISSEQVSVMFLSAGMEDRGLIPMRTG